MVKPIQKSVLFLRTLRRLALRVFVVLLLVAFLSPVYTYTRAYLRPSHVSAATGINHQISFQGKLVNPDGTNVTDGSYSIVFSIYTVASAGAAIWTETQTPTVTNGIFQVNLGSVTTLPGSIDFNTDNIYLGIKVGADAEMTPRVQFTAVPQAFNAEKLGGLDKTGFIQNQSGSAQATSSFWISGAGKTDTSLTTPVLQSAAGAALGITGNAASTWSTTAGSLTLQGFGGVTINTPTAAATNAISIATGVASAGASGTVTVATGNATTGTGIISLTTGNASAGTAGNVTLDVGTSSAGQGSILIGNAARAQTVTIGNVTGATALNLKVGTGNFTLDGVTNSTFDIAASTTTGTIAIGGTAQTGTTTIGRSTDTNTIGIGTGVTATTKTQTITLGGSGASGSTATINIGNNATAGSTTNVTVGSTIAGTITLQSATQINLNSPKLSRTAAGTTTFDLVDASNTTFALTNSGAGAAQLSIDGLTTAGIVTNTAAGLLGTVAAVPAANGGTGQAGGYTIGDMLYASGATTLSKLAAVASGSCLISQGVGVAPVWGACTTGSITGLTLAGTSGVNQAITNGDTITIAAGTNITTTGAATDTITVATVNNPTFSTSVTTPSVSNTAGLTLNATSAALTLQTTTSGNVVINGAGILDVQDNATFAGTLQVTGASTLRGVTIDSATGTNDKLALSVTTVGAGSFTGTMTNADLTAARTYTFQDNSGVVALGTAANSLFFTTTAGTNVTLPTTGTLCSTATCLTAEADTLATVTGRGATTATASSFTGTLTVSSATATTALNVTSSSTGTGQAISLTNTAGTQAAGLSITRNGAGGTTTSLLNLTNTAGTVTDALTIVGTFTNILNSPTVDINNAGAISGLTAVTSSGNITFSGLNTAGIVTNTAAGLLGTVAAIPVANGGTGLSSYTTGDLLYASGATTIAKLADVAAGSCLRSGGVGVAPTWGVCSASSTLQADYTQSTGGTTPEIKLDSTRGAVDIQDADTSINNNLFTVRASNAGGLGSALFNVNSTGQTTFQNSVDSTSAFNIQDANGINVIQVSTNSNNSNPVTNPSVEVNTTGWNARTGTTLSRTTTASNYYYGNAAVQAVNTATAGAGINYPIALAPNTVYGIHAMLKMTVNGTVSFGYAADGATETTYVAATEYGGNAGTGWYDVNLVFTTPATVSPSAYIFLKQNDTTARTMYIDGLFAESGGIGQRYQENQITLGDAATKVVLGAPASNTISTLSAALTVVQSRYGYEGLIVKGTPENDLFRGPIFDVRSSQDSQILWVTEGAGAAVHVSGGSGFWGSAALTVATTDAGAVGLRVTGAASQSGNLLQVQDNSGNPLFTVGSGGDISANNKIAIQSYDTYLRLNPTSAFTSGIYTPGTFRADGEVQSFSANSFRMVQGNYGAFWRNDGSTVYLLSTNGLDQLGGWNANRPFAYNLGTGDVALSSPNWSISSTGANFLNNSISVSAGGINIGNGSSITMDFVGTGTTSGVCYSGTNATGNAYNRVIVSCNGTPSDYAEFYPTETSVEPGDVVATSPNMLTYEGSGADAETGLIVDTGIKHISILKKAAIGDSSVGIISTAPYAVIGKDIPTTAHRLPLAMNGRVPVKVNNEGGPIAAGDQLTLSTVPGYATKATVAGKTIAVALEPFDGTSGSIMVYVQPGYYDPSASEPLQGSELSITGNAAIGGNLSLAGQLNVSGATTLTSLEVTGNATVRGNLTVAGDIETRNIKINGHIITSGDAPQVAVQIGAGTEDVPNNIAAPTVTVEGNDTSGTLTITTGANTLADELAKITFANAFSGKPRIVLTPANRDSADLNAYYNASETTADSFSILAKQTPQAGKTYIFTYFVVQ